MESLKIKSETANHNLDVLAASVLSLDLQPGAEDQVNTIDINNTVEQVHIDDENHQIRHMQMENSEILSANTLNSNIVHTQASNGNHNSTTGMQTVDQEHVVPILLAASRPTCHRYIKSISVQLILISACFLLGYIPTTVYMIWTTYNNVNDVSMTEKDLKIDYWCGVLSYLCLRVSECMNPVMYFLASSTMRAEAKNMVSNFFHRP